MNELTALEIRELKSASMKLKPVVIIGHDGLTAGVLQEIVRALHDHELIKIRINAENSEERATITEQICQKTDATLIQTIGFIIAIYRKSEETESGKAKRRKK